MKYSVLCLVLLMVLVSTSQARVWTTAKEGIDFEAELKSVSNTAVRLQLTADGSVHRIPLAELSKYDRDYVRKARPKFGRTGTPSEVYFAYRKALKNARSLSQVRRFFSDKEWGGPYSRSEKEEIENQKRWYILNPKVIHERLRGDVATVLVAGEIRSDSKKSMHSATELTFVKERGCWKIKKQRSSARSLRGNR